MKNIMPTHSPAVLSCKTRQKAYLEGIYSDLHVSHEVILLLLQFRGSVCIATSFRYISLHLAAVSLLPHLIGEGCCAVS